MAREARPERQGLVEALVQMWAGCRAAGVGSGVGPHVDHVQSSREKLRRWPQMWTRWKAGKLTCPSICGPGAERQGLAEALVDQVQSGGALAQVRMKHVDRVRSNKGLVEAPVHV